MMETIKRRQYSGKIEMVFIDICILFFVKYDTKFE